MSAKSAFLRGVYGVEQRPKTAKSKYAFYREQQLERGAIALRAAKIFDREVAKREARQSKPKARATCVG